MDIRIRSGSVDDLPRVREFYEARGYGGGCGPSDEVFLVQADGELIGTVRLVSEEGATVLRGMQVHPDFQRRGIGTRLLETLAIGLGDRACFCIPYAHLIEFYGRVGFALIEPEEAPRFLSERLSRYRTRGDAKDYVLMHRPGLPLPGG